MSKWIFCETDYIQIFFLSWVDINFMFWVNPKKNRVNSPGSVSLFAIHAVFILLYSSCHLKCFVSLFGLLFFTCLLVNNIIWSSELMASKINVINFCWLLYKLPKYIRFLVFVIYLYYFIISFSLRENARNRWK